MAGGNDAAKTSIYDPETNAWTAEEQMRIPRGYQSVSYSFEAILSRFLLHLIYKDMSQE